MWIQLRENQSGHYFEGNYLIISFHCPRHVSAIQSRRGWVGGRVKEPGSLMRLRGRKLMRFPPSHTRRFLWSAQRVVNILASSVVKDISESRHLIIIWQCRCCCFGSSWAAFLHSSFYFCGCSNQSVLCTNFFYMRKLRKKYFNNVFVVDDIKEISTRLPIHIRLSLRRLPSKEVLFRVYVKLSHSAQWCCHWGLSATSTSFCCLRTSMLLRCWELLRLDHVSSSH